MHALADGCPESSAGLDIQLAKLQSDYCPDSESHLTATLAVTGWYCGCGSISVSIRLVLTITTSTTHDIQAIKDLSDSSSDFVCSLWDRELSKLSQDELRVL